MNLPGQIGFRLHEFEVNPSENTIAGPDGKRMLRPSSMDVLVHLSRRAGEFIDCDELLRAVFPQSESDYASLQACVQELQSCLNDNQPDARFIELHDERGYRLLAPVVPLDDYIFETDSGPIHVQPIEGSANGDFLLQTSSGPVVLHPVTGHEKTESSGWLAELQRRRVFRVVGAYAVAAWLILQIVDVLSGALPVPDWTLSATAVSLAVGFPITALLAWIFQITPKGIVQDNDSRKNNVSIDRTRLVHYIDLIIIAVLLVVVVFLSYGRIFPELKLDEHVTVAVLPFENLSADSDDLYLSEGIADDIRSRLYEIPQLLIAARTSSRSLSGKGFDVREIGERLGVKHVLEGTVRREDDRIRLSVHLVDVVSGFNLWNKIYDTRIANVLDLQNKISLVVASELRVVLTRELRQVLAENVTDDPVAYDLYLQARSYHDRPISKENLERASALFEDAIARDASFALGYSGLCQVYISRYLHSGDTAFVEHAEINCNQALALDSRLSEVHTALGGLYLLSGKLEQAEKSFNSAIEFDFRAVDAYSGLGEVFAKQQKLLEAESQYNQAIELLPANWNGYNKLARFLLQQGRYDEAAANYRRAIELAPDNAHGYNNLGVIYYLRGDFEKAAENYRRSLELAPGRAAYSNTGTMYYFAGNYAEAAAMFSKAAEEAATDYRLWGNLADAQRFDESADDKGRRSYQKAIDLAKAQLEVNAADADTLTNLAWYYANMGDFDAAHRSLKSAQTLAASTASQQYIAALVYVLLGESDEAEQAIALAISLGFPQAILEATPELANTPLVDD